MKNPAPRERRRLKRWNITYYLPILDNQTQKIIGHLMDISPVGLLMDSKFLIQKNQVHDLHLDFNEAIAGRASVDFIARGKWCRLDPIAPLLYDVGFEIIRISPEDIEVIKGLAQKYGAG